MPIYQHECGQCKDAQGNPKILEFHRPMSRASDLERCPDCQSETQRVYSFNREKEFFAYQDEQYKCEISSKRQEKAIMKQHGHVDFRETAAYGKDRWKECRRIARRKPSYFIPGVKQVIRDRD